MVVRYKIIASLCISAKAEAKARALKHESSSRKHAAIELMPESPLVSVFVILMQGI